MNYLKYLDSGRSLVRYFSIIEFLKPYHIQPVPRPRSKLPGSSPTTCAVRTAKIFTNALSINKQVLSA